jgi:hypothetical protein
MLVLVDDITYSILVIAVHMSEGAVHRIAIFVFFSFWKRNFGCELSDFA